MAVTQARSGAYGSAADHGITDTVVVESGFSWRAALAGVAVALAVSSVIHLLGAALGLTPTSVDAESTPSATTLSIASSIWLTVSTVIGFVAGGYVAGYAVPCLARRDGATRGVVVWAVTIMIVGLVGTTALMRATGSAVQGVASVASSGIGSMLGAGGAGLGGLLAQQGQSGGQDRAGDLARQLTEDLSAMPPAQMSPEQAGQELGRLATKLVSDGQWAPGDRERAAELLARINGTSPEEAMGRIDAAEQRIQQETQQMEQTAKDAAEVAARSVAGAAYWAFFTVALGLLAAALGGHLGARRWA
jgi:hypothetical protein